MRNIAIERTNAFDHDQDSLVKKLLLLGAGESGKSTLFKQMVDLYGTGFTEKDVLEYVCVVYNNTISSMKTLCGQSDILSAQGKTECSISSDHNEAKALIMSLDPDIAIQPEIAEAIKLLWKDQGIQETYKLRSSFQLQDSAEYFFSRVDGYAKSDFRPNKQDILRCRVRTTGILETTFKIEDLKFQMFDVGGQRNERKKWIHCFENVTAVIFVAALSEFDQLLYEDNETNRLEEALVLFDEICNSRWFKDTAIILFLNKRDLFEEKLRVKRLKDSFPQYDGDNSFESAWQWISQKFTEKRNDESKKIYTHVTCATDDQNIMYVFNSVKDIIIRKGLAKSGLL